MLKIDNRYQTGMDDGNCDDHDTTAAYKAKTPTSARLFEESARLHVNGVSHNIRYFEPYPFVVAAAAGSTLIDVDENRYTDYWMGHWSLVLGHVPASVAEEIHKQADLGWMYGTLNEQTISLSKAISRAVPVAEKIRYTASGTEAVMYAARLARSRTKRSIIAKIDGGWHGYASDVLGSVNWPFDEPESTGLVGEDHLISVPYNDLDAATRILDRYKDQLAGIIVEPVLGGAGCIPASIEYMLGMQEYAHRAGALYVADEIVTGFRFSYGCMYQEMGLDPDIVTLGKIIGGGLPIGAICGKDDVMSQADASRDDRSYIGGGTFSANPASMTAGAATLRHLRNNKSTYDRINMMGEHVRSGLAEVLGRESATITGTGSLFMVHFARDGKVHSITDARQAALCNQYKLNRYHMHLIAREGIFMLPGKLGAISGAHTNDDIKHLVAASENFCQ